MKKISSVIIFLFGFLMLNAQDGILPNEGKMLPTVLVLAAILIGVFVFLFILERRLSKLEKQINNE